MRLVAAIILTILLLFHGNSTDANSESTLQELDQLADEALQLTKFSRLEEAKAILERFAVQFSEQGIKEGKFTMDELRVLTASHHEALRAVTNINMSLEERIRLVTSFRLAADAISSTHQPMWIEMEASVMKEFQKVKNAALEGNKEAYNQNLNTFLSTYTVIQPSLKIDLAAEKLQKLDSKITYIDRYRSDFSEQEWTAHLESLEQDLQKIFSNPDEDEADPSLWWVISMTGSIIILTLSYVSWRKYRGEKQQKKSKDPNN
ncbi:sporulation protein YpjB [Siminovitchia acidinfaciens]|uniref:Sporulation protein YpjB n=1 Tax=Siminovitchia acidinfaciens TaxID=2321395 RepID=A0A429XY46_9BACI|nr:sporulation protein YpjB [Siminovitchia acidinfaciens]RST73651.1 sporulation protein YpjB [Siminovitchia acidinfaciens]